MKKDIALMCSNVRIDAYTGDSVTAMLIDVDVNDVVREIGESALVEALIAKIGRDELLEVVGQD